MFPIFDALRRDFLLRWTLANIVGWTAGLYLGTLGFSLPVLCLGGVWAGGCLGLAQWFALRDLYPVDRYWVFASMAGAAWGALAASVAGLLVVLGWGLGIAAAGAVLGGAVGGTQWLLLRALSSRAGWWLAANLAGGAVCALLTFAPLIRGLPLGLLLGSALYGYLTGRVIVMSHAPSVSSSAS